MAVGERTVSKGVVKKRASCTVFEDDKTEDKNIEEWQIRSYGMKLSSVRQIGWM